MIRTPKFLLDDNVGLRDVAEEEAAGDNIAGVDGQDDASIAGSEEDITAAEVCCLFAK